MGCCRGCPPTHPRDTVTAGPFGLSALQAELHVLDRAVTLVELLDTAGCRCCCQRHRPGAATPAPPCPGVSRGNEPLADEVSHPHIVAVLAELIGTSLVIETSSPCSSPELGVFSNAPGHGLRNRAKPGSALSFGNDGRLASCSPRRACGASLRSTKSLLPLGLVVAAEPAATYGAGCQARGFSVFSQCPQCFTTAEAGNKANRTQMTMQSDTGLFGWRQDLLKLVRKGLVTTP